MEAGVFKMMKENGKKKRVVSGVCILLLVFMMSGMTALLSGCGLEVASVRADADTIREYEDELSAFDGVRFVDIQYSADGASFFVQVETDGITDAQAEEIRKITDAFVNDHTYEQLAEVQKKTFQRKETSHRIRLLIDCEDYSRIRIYDGHIVYDRKSLYSYRKQYTTSEWESYHNS